jgi:lipopolysaccharide export LptBFGC system permease protein LptF
VKRTITQDILTWSKDFIEKPNVNLGNLPVCPFAKKTREDNKLKVIEVKQGKDFLNKVVSECQSFGNYDVVIVACDDMYITADDLNNYVHALNKVFVKEDVYLIASYPDDEEIDFLESDDFEPDNDFYMVLIQSYQKLKDGSSSLRKTNYYEHWSDDYFADTVLVRQQYGDIHGKRNEKKK